MTIPEAFLVGIGFPAAIDGSYRGGGHEEFVRLQFSEQELRGDILFQT
jgi:hypothetical protein